MEALLACGASVVQAAVDSTALREVMGAVEAEVDDAEVWTAAVLSAPAVLSRTHLTVSRGSRRRWTCPTSRANVPGMGGRSSRPELHAAPG